MTTPEAQNSLGPVWVVRDFDSCACGDYRHQHVRGEGRCTMPNDITHGFRPCTAFRLTREADAIPEAYRHE